MSLSNESLILRMILETPNTDDIDVDEIFFSICIKDTCHLGTYRKSIALNEKKNYLTHERNYMD